MKTMVDHELYKLELTTETAGGKAFKLAKVVCNHGMFMMAPNDWDPSTETLHRPLRLPCATSVSVAISQPPNHPFLCVRILHQHLSSHDLHFIQSQIERMFRISEKDQNNLQEFHHLHPEARKKGFGRLFHSPTLFEDAVKSLLLCNCQFSRTLEMANGLCNLQYDLAHCGSLHKSRKKGMKRKRNVEPSSSLGNFPTPQEICSVSLSDIERYCNMGYRAKTVVNLAQQIASGNLKEFENIGELNSAPEQIYNKLLKIKGFGHFTCANLLVCLGFYHLVPHDTETVRLLQMVHGREISKKQVSSLLEQLYTVYAPFQSLAYWFDMITYYENRVGSLSQLERSNYSTVSGSFLAANKSSAS